LVSALGWFLGDKRSIANKWNKILTVSEGKRTVPCFSCTFFCLIKRTKNQECRISSGRHSTLRAWAFTVLVLYVLAPCHFQL